MPFFKKKTEDAPGPDTENQAFPNIGEDDPNALLEPAVVDPTLAAFEAFRAEAAAREERFFAALANQSAQYAPAPGVAPTASVAPSEFVPQVVPDAMEDPEGHDRAFEANIVGRIQHGMDAQAHERNTNAAQANASAQASEGMWEEFSTQYEDLAQHEDLVEIYAGRRIKALREKGIDVDAYLSRNRDAFIKNVAEDVGGRLVALGAVPNPDPSPPPGPKLVVNRTGGIPGNGGPSISAVQDKDQPGSMVLDIFASRKKMGLD